VPGGSLTLRRVASNKSPSRGRPTVALLTDLWPSQSEPHSGRFVLGEVEALREHYRHVVLVPWLILPRAHRWIWGAGVQGWQRGRVALPLPDRMLAYPMLRVPKRSEVAARALGAGLVLRRAQERPALVHGHFLLDVGPAAVALARKLGVPVVLTAHGTDARWLLEGGVQERRRKVMREACLAADQMIVVSKPIAEGLASIGVPRAKLATIPMGVDGELFRPLERKPLRRTLGLEQEARVVLFVGRATAEKGFEVLDQALEELPGVACFAAGPGPLSSSRIRALGVLEPQVLASWLAAADVVCLPSFAEGMPVSILEALACGTPVVATRVGGIPDQIEAGKNGFLVDPGNPHELAEALDRALASKWSREEVRASSEPFWWASVAARLEAIYRQLIA
jgi:teichuronic acid biosynthesis glycosyltransferase TuaC